MADEIGVKNVRSDELNQLADTVMDKLGELFKEGMQADVAAQTLVALAVDLWRVNYGDAFAEKVLKRQIDLRLSRTLKELGCKIPMRDLN